MEMEDMEGRILNGRDSLVILTDAIENGRRCKKGKGNEGKKRYQEFEVRKRERKQRREKVKDMVRNIGPMVLVMWIGSGVRGMRVGGHVQWCGGRESVGGGGQHLYEGHGG
ncbi:hypothetical protein HS088_TW07G00477 [Tripterygium wilfordii]|uniref:Uncharacterized protein n=1 Tax=Tripterygium wilfordii TaxID=458696 RepID=A0A7J7DFR3_TRIWF|nr:hypothetical protein HS088_TW07G00477 [Tripterygium wilfordii]